MVQIFWTPPSVVGGWYSIDIARATDKVWQTGLLNKVTFHVLTHQFCILIEILPPTGLLRFLLTVIIHNWINAYVSQSSVLALRLFSLHVITVLFSIYHLVRSYSDYCSLIHYTRPPETIQLHFNCTSI